MFLLGVALLCSAVLVFVNILLMGAQRRSNGRKSGELIEEIAALIITTCFFGGGISLVLAVQMQNSSVAQYAIGAALIVATVLIVKLMRVPSRLAAYRAAEASGEVIEGHFGKPGSDGTPQKTYRKAA